MKYLWFTLLFLAQATMMTAQEKETLYKTLDSLIAHYDHQTAEKELHIRTIKDGASGITLTPEQYLELNIRLYDEYMAYKYDSAFQYIQENVGLLRGTEDHNRFAASAVRMAHILSVTGLFNMARELMEEINPDVLDVQQRVDYYTQQSELNLYRSEMAQYTPFFAEFIGRAQYYRQLIIQIAPKGSYDYIFNQATYTCETGDEDKAIQMLEDYLPQLKSGTRTYSIITSTLAYFYQRKQNLEQQEHYLLLSAISDERGAIRENNSLRSLSELLMDKGDCDNAYRYLFQSFREAQFYGSRLRLMQMGRIAPQVMQLYDEERSQTQRLTTTILIIISIVSLILIGGIFYTLKLIRKNRSANQQILEMNKTLAVQNEAISNINNQMKEANRIKEEYIGRFLELSSVLIERGEKRLKLFNRLARERKLEELYAELKKTEPVNNSIHDFHQDFDVAFLNIFPDFIANVNQLLTTENRFEQEAESAKRLTTELRILALLRLGISDNQKIADILRSSLTTIYTYRSKLKAKAIHKETFEDDIRKIATY
jgi:hypothetical protein